MISAGVANHGGAADGSPARWTDDDITPASTLASGGEPCVRGIIERGTAVDRLDPNHGMTGAARIGFVHAHALLPWLAGVASHWPKASPCALGTVSAGWLVSALWRGYLGLGAPGTSADQPGLWAEWIDGRPTCVDVFGWTLGNPYCTMQRMPAWAPGIPTILIHVVERAIDVTVITWAMSNPFPSLAQPSDHLRDQVLGRPTLTTPFQVDGVKRRLSPPDEIESGLRYADCGVPRNLERERAA